MTSICHDKSENSVHNWVCEHAEGYLVDPADPSMLLDLSDQRAQHKVLQVATGRSDTYPNGLFRAVFRCSVSGDLLLVPDAIGSLPLYYLETGRNQAWSTDFWTLVRESSAAVDRTALVEVCLFHYVLGRRTLAEGVSETGPAEIVRLSMRNGVQRRIAWRLEYADEIVSQESLFEQLDQTLTRVLDRHMAWLGDHSVLLKLSGGLDSRLLLMRTTALRNVITATFYTGIDRDLLVAEGLAALYDRRHFAVRLTGDECEDESIRDAALKASGGRTLPYITWGSSRIMSRIPEGLVTAHLPGHTLDFVSGDQITEQQLRAEQGGDDVALWCDRHMLPRRYRWVDSDASAVLGLLREEDSIRDDIGAAFGGSLAREPWRVCHDFNLQQRQRRFILTDGCFLTAHGRLSLPYWDLDLVQLFARCSSALLYKRSALHEYLRRAYKSDARLSRVRVPDDGASTPATLWFRSRCGPGAAGISRVAQLARERIGKRGRRPAKLDRYCWRAGPFDRASRVVERILPEAISTYYEKRGRYILADLDVVLDHFERCGGVVDY